MKFSSACLIPILAGPALALPLSSIRQHAAQSYAEKRAPQDSMGLDPSSFTGDINSETDAYMQAQKDMFLAEMQQQNAMQQQTTEQEFAQKMNDAAWQTASGAASDQIQRRAPQDSITDAYMEAQKEMFEAEMQQQNAMQQQTTEEEFAQKMNDEAWKTASEAASDKIQRKKRQDSINSIADGYMEAQKEMFEAEMEAENQKRAPEDIDSETEAYMEAQKEMFEAEMKAQNEMQAQTTEEEFAQKMNDAAWKIASDAASDKIQR